MASEIKLKRYESLIIDVVNKTIAMEVNNPLVKQARATYCKLSNDLSLCKIYVVCQDDKNESKIIEIINKIKGLFRSRICEVLDIYKTPQITFDKDKTIDYARNIDRILKDIKEKKHEE